MNNISVIVPVYNVEKYLNRCVDSILHQTYHNFDVILVDDGSTDGSPQICDKYAELDSRVHIIHQKNGKVASARNAGLDWAMNNNSEWVAFIDSDDWVHPQYLQILFNIANKTGADVVVSGYKEANELETFVLADQNEFNIWNAELFYCEKNLESVAPWGKIYRKSCFESIRYPEGKIGEDEYITYRILFNANKIASVQDILYFYFVNTDSVTRRNWSPVYLSEEKAFTERIHFFKKRGLGKAKNKAVISYVWFLEDTLNRIKKCEGKYKHYVMLLGLKYRCILLRYSKSIQITKNIQRYEKAFPFTAWIFWTALGIKNKIKQHRT